MSTQKNTRTQSLQKRSPLRGLLWHYICGDYGKSLAIEYNKGCRSHIAIHILSAFAVELYLKTLLAMETPQQKTRGHDLLKLYGRCSSGTKHIADMAYFVFQAREKFSDLRRLKTGELTEVEFDAHGFLRKGALSEALDLLNGLFVEWRYAHEEGNLDMARANNPGVHLNAALVHAILVKRPEWQDFARDALDMNQYFSHLNLSVQYFPEAVLQPDTLSDIL